MSLPRAVHRTVLVVDVSAFGDRRRTDLHRIAVRRVLYDVLERACDEAGVRWRDCEHEDRGDGVLVVVPATVPKSVLVQELPDELAAALRKHNTSHPDEERIRLRLAVHAGEIHYDDHGVVGQAVNLVFRLLEAPAFTEAHARSTGALSMVTSAWFFEEVVWHGPAAERDSYRRVHVAVKETDTTAWCRLVDGEPLVGDAHPRPAPGRHVPYQLPSSNRLFVGRDDELARLVRLAEAAPGTTGSSATLVITAIDGTAGIGKTALALTLAHRVRDRFRDGQLHVNLRGFDEHEPVDPCQVLHGFLQALGVSPQAVPPDVESRSALYRSLLADRRMLVVLDNARSTEHVRPLLPGSPTCLVVITSRNRLDSLLVRDGAHRIALDVLSRDDALALLAERVDGARLDADRDAAAELIDLCDRLPLALSLAAARAATQPNLTMRDLVRELHDENGRLDALDIGETDLNLRAVFSWSYSVLSPEAARLFRLLGVHPGADIGIAACQALVGGNAPAMLRELAGAHLITEHTPGRFRFHDLLRAYAAELSAADPERAAAVRRLVEHYLTTALLADRNIQPHRYGRDAVEQLSEADDSAVGDYERAMAWFTAEHLTLQALVGFAEANGLPSHAWRLAWACTTFLRRTGRWPERVAIYRTALTAARDAGDRLGEAVTSRHLGTAIARMGQIDEAFEQLRHAADLYRELADTAGTFKNHLGYARVFEARENYTKAWAHAQVAWELVRVSDDRLGHADALTTLGRQLCGLRRHADALPLCTRALELYTKIGHPEGQADVLLNLGDIERNLGRRARAIDYYQRSLELDRWLGDRFWEAVSLERLADAYQDDAVEGADLALAALRRALAIYRELRHPAAERVHTRLTSPVRS